MVLNLLPNHHISGINKRLTIPKTFFILLRNKSENTPTSNNEAPTPPTSHHQLYSTESKINVWLPAIIPNEPIRPIDLFSVMLYPVYSRYVLILRAEQNMSTSVIQNT